VIQERFAREAEFAGAGAVIALRISLAMPRTTSVSHLDIGQVLLKVRQFFMHRHTVVLTTIADLDPTDYARRVDPTGAGCLAQVSVGETRTESPVLKRTQ
jgi:hypothetical protein